MRDTIQRLRPTTPDTVTTNPTWRDGVPAQANPHVGGLWVVAVDLDSTTVDLCAVLVTRVNTVGRYVLAMPVTFDTTTLGHHILRLDTTPLGVPAHLWPQAETGLDYATLTRYLGPTNLTADQLRQAAKYGEGEAPAPLPVVDAPADATVEHDAFISQRRNLCDLMTLACYANSTAE